MDDMGVLGVLAYSGGDWIIYLLLLCSVAVVAVIAERLMIRSRERKALEELKRSAAPLLGRGDLSAAAEAAGRVSGAAARVLAASLANAKDGPASVEERAAAARILEKQGLEKRLLVLGTLGNNAPFVGLFGTVLGVIKAFHDLAATASAGPEVVMKGLSEALIATAVGLLVAIPAVVAYNYLQKDVDDLLGETDALVRLALARMKAGKDR